MSADLLLLLPAGFVFVLLVFLAGAYGQRQLSKGDPMSLLDDVKEVGDLVRSGLSRVPALEAEIEQGKTALAAAVTEAEQVKAELASKAAEGEQLAQLVAQLRAEFTGAPATEQPAS